MVFAFALGNPHSAHFPPIKIVRTNEDFLLFISPSQKKSPGRDFQGRTILSNATKQLREYGVQVFVQRTESGFDSFFLSLPWLGSIDVSPKLFLVDAGDLFETSQ